MRAVKYTPQCEVPGNVLERMLGPRSHEQEVAWLEGPVEFDLRKKGLEPLRPFGHQLLRLARLPIPPLPHGAQ